MLFHSRPVRAVLLDLGYSVGIRRRNASPAANGEATNPTSGSRSGMSGSRGGGRGRNREESST